MIALPNDQPERHFLTVEEIRTQAADYPTVRMVTGEQFHVDQNGLLMFGNPYRIREKPSPELVAICLRWLERAEKIKTPGLNSYGLKHAVERWAGEYVSNGAFILAAHELGFRMIPDDRTWRATLNVDVGISRRWYHKQPESLYYSDGVGA
ncbi:hypothetical protein Enr13x_12530 [Stieleria neptunia]|uniref:Uncharacterized protein n=1 Tax=Stieleria neptunia TaxID=2527979 RepID=A0A518HKP3_9BACT|nr:hypothetical protein [Stieleria neptunia]QDV41414.1 hypothetical protein Enr13x_12530 [Stieleria neptunia]